MMLLLLMLFLVYSTAHITAQQTNVQNYARPTLDTLVWLFQKEPNLNKEIKRFQKGLKFPPLIDWIYFIVWGTE